MMIADFRLQKRVVTLQEIRLENNCLVVSVLL